MMRPPPAAAPVATAIPDRQDEIVHELKALRALFETRPAQPQAQAAAPQAAPANEARKLKIELDVIGEAIKQTRGEIEALQGQGFDSDRITRARRELEAVVEGVEQGTERILKAAEQIDETANMLAALVKTTHEKGMAQDIQERLTQIYEACNFHDLTGQRINKTVVTLKMVEDHLARMMEIWGVIERFNTDTVTPAAEHLGGLLNGPKVEGDVGHSSQGDIDKLFL
jgi:chemotaxis protein CheZ